MKQVQRKDSHPLHLFLFVQVRVSQWSGKPNMGFLKRSVRRGPSLSSLGGGPTNKEKRP